MTEETLPILAPIHENLMCIVEGYYYAMETASARPRYINAIEKMIEAAKSWLPINAYRVVCDSSNNTEESLARGEIHTDVYLQEAMFLDFKRIGNISGGHQPMTMIDFEIDLSSGSVSSQGSVGSGGFSVSGGGGVSVGGGVPNGNSHQHSIGSAVPVGGQYITNTNGPVSAMYGVIGTITLEEPIPTDPNLPAITFNTHDENKVPMKLHLRPESTISTIEALRLMMMIHAYNKNPLAFSIYGYVKQQSLERHFKFEY